MAMFKKNKQQGDNKPEQDVSTAQPGNNPDHVQHALFFKKPVPLDMARHSKAGCIPVKDYAFAAHTNSIPVNMAEFIEAAKSYPIVYTEGELPLPVAIVGLEQANYFIDNKGEWKNETYIPAYVRKYPFIFMHAPEAQQFILCVDEASAHFRMNGGEGVLPFYVNSNASETSRAALEFCTAFHNHHQATRQFCKALKEAGLLVPNTSNATLYNGRNIRLGGFQVIDEKKFNELPDSTILEFRKKGILPYIYFSLMSANNWKRIVDMAGQLEKNALPVMKAKAH